MQPVQHPRPIVPILGGPVDPASADHYLNVVPAHLPPTYGFSSDLLRRAWRVLRHLS